MSLLFSSSFPSFGWVAGFLRWIVRLRDDGRWIRFRSFGTSACALVVDGFVWVHVRHMRPLGLFGLAWFVRVRPEGCCVLYGSSGSSGCAMGVAMFV